MRGVQKGPKGAAMTHSDVESKGRNVWECGAEPSMEDESGDSGELWCRTDEGGVKMEVRQDWQMRSGRALHGPQCL